MQQHRQTKRWTFPSKWCIRFFKGMLIGSGLLLPGINSAVLLMLYGFYKPLNRFLMQPTKHLRQQLAVFLPIITGLFSGMLCTAYVMNGLFLSFETILLWLFLGCAFGSLPAFWKISSQNGRSQHEWGILGFASLISGLLFYIGKAQFPPLSSIHIALWFTLGSLLALGIIIPLFSPAIFLIYFGWYHAVISEMLSFQATRLLLFVVGFGVTLFLIANVRSYCSPKTIASILQVMLAISITSWLILIPTNYEGFSTVHYLACMATFGFGAWLGVSITPFPHTH